jgi:acetyltransferase-like isoleucine patch superfamily enzyme
MLPEWLSRLRDRWLLRSYVRAGLKLGRDVRVIGKPDFGSEPYLIEIGDHVTISSNVSLITHDGATWVFRHLPSYRGLQRFGRIVIGDNCFIGAGAIIMPGVSIGTNSVVGAGAVVTLSVPANTVVAGVPARHICSYEEYVERMIPRCRYFPPDVAADRKKLKDVLLSTIPHPTAKEGQSPASSGSVGET